MSRHSGPKVILYLPMKVLTTSHHNVQDSLKRLTAQQPQTGQQLKNTATPGRTRCLTCLLTASVSMSDPEGKTTILLLLLATYHQRPCHHYDPYLS